VYSVLSPRTLLRAYNDDLVAAPDGDTVISEAYDATSGLADEGVYVTDTPFFVAAYDPPFRLSNRHDEIWLLASSPESKSGTASSRKLKL